MLIVRDIVKSFGSLIALHGVSLQAAPGEIVGLLGPSGCGKSTLLKVIAGLLTPDSGSILWGDTELNSVPTHRRNFGLMFQDYALFPHRNVYQNVAFGLQQQGQSAAQIRPIVTDLLQRIGLPDYETRSVLTLSGGEQQRVALARALAPQPRLLMLDEPLGALDRTLRDSLVIELNTLLRQLGQTALYVTHDQGEAFALCDRVLIMETGTVVQSGPPAELYQRPVNPFVARFLGLTNIFSAEITPTGLQLPWGELVWPTADLGPIGPATVLIRPEAELAQPDQPGTITGTVTQCLYQGRNYRVTLTSADHSLIFEVPISQPAPLGSLLTVRPQTITAFQANHADHHQA